MTLNGKFKVKAIKKKTSAVFFKDLKIDDEFVLVYNLNGRYKSAPTIYIYYDGECVHENNAVQLSDNLDKFDLEKIEYNNS